MFRVAPTHSLVDLTEGGARVQASTRDPRPPRQVSLLFGLEALSLNESTG